ncbi:hypothetical protein YC2023_084758 [Brassica napus]
MGKRKSRAKPATTKRMDKLDTVFSCPFCNHGSSVECQIYSEWIDECERVNTVEDDVEQEEEVEEEEVYEEEEEEEEEVEEEDDEDARVSVKRKFNYRDD